MPDTITTEDLRNKINKMMRYHRLEMQRWKEALKTRIDENDYALNARLSMEVAMHQGAWCTLLCLAGDLKIALGEEEQIDETVRFGIDASVTHNGVKYGGRLYPVEVVK